MMSILNYQLYTSAHICIFKDRNNVYIQISNMAFDVDHIFISRQFFKGRFNFLHTNRALYK